MTNALPRSTPEAEGIPSGAVLRFLDGVDSEGLELHSFMLLRHGKVVAEGWWHPYRPDDVHLLYSLSKSFTSTAIGFAVSEGRLNLDDRVIDFFPDDAPPEPSENLKSMRVRDLLTMSTGHEEDGSPMLPQGDRWVKWFLARPVPHPPGTHFLYNNGATYTLSAILQQLTGQTLLEYLRPRLLDPLGIENATWASNDEGINLGATGLSVTTESIAKFGLLYLRDGVLDGQRVLPEGWVAEATRAYVSTDRNDSPDWQQGYGFQFWRCRHGAFRGDGAFGQNSVVMPAQDAVFVTTAGADRLQPILDQLWQHLLLAMTETPLPDDAAARDELSRRVSNLVLAGPTGARHSGLADELTGRVFTHDGGKFRWDFDEDRCQLSITEEGRDHRLVAGLSDWLSGSTSFDTSAETPYAALGRWQDESTFVLRVQYILTPASTTLTCRFTGGNVHVKLTRSGTFLPSEGPHWEAIG